LVTLPETAKPKMELDPTVQRGRKREFLIRKTPPLVEHSDAEAAIKAKVVFLHNIRSW
jgi:hypothetical protein